MQFPCMIFYVRRKEESDLIQPPTLEEAIKSLEQSDPVIESHTGKKFMKPREQRAQDMIDITVGANQATLIADKKPIESLGHLETVKAEVEALDGFQRWVTEF